MDLSNPAVAEAKARAEDLKAIQRAAFERALKTTASSWQVIDGTRLLLNHGDATLEGLVSQVAALSAMAGWSGAMLEGLVKLNPFVRPAVEEMLKEARALSANGVRVHSGSGEGQPPTILGPNGRRVK